MSRAAICMLTVVVALCGGAVGLWAALASSASHPPHRFDSSAIVDQEPDPVERVRRRVRGHEPGPGPAAVGGVSEAGVSEGGESLERAGVLVFGSRSGLPLEVTLVDGDTGAVFAGGHVAISEGNAQRDAEDVPSLVPTVLDGGLHRAAAISAGRGDRVRVAIDVEPPAGYVTGGVGWSTRVGMRVSPFARSLRATVPLRRPVDVHVDVRSTGGHRIHRRLTSMSVMVGRHFYLVDYAPLRPPYRVTVPFLRGEKIYAGVCTATSSADAEIVLDEYAPRVDLAIRVPPKSRDPSSAGRPPAGSVPYCRGPDPTWEGSATIFVQVRLADGRCAAGARVAVRRPGAGGIRSSKRLGDDGLAHFDHAPPGTYTVRVSETGMVLTTATVEVVDGGRHFVRLVEPVGETAGITVVNHRGVRLPFARVEVEDCGLAPGGVQLLDHFTDANGVCRIERMSDEPSDVVVYWAGREVSTTWRPGEPLTVTVPRVP